MTAKRGQRLLTTARERTPGILRSAARRLETHATFLYDEAGHGIESDEPLTALLEGVRDDLWIAPVLAFSRTESGDDKDSKSQRHHGPKRTNLTCRECDRDTTHQFQSVEGCPTGRGRASPSGSAGVAERIGTDPLQKVLDSPQSLVENAAAPRSSISRG